MAPANGPLGKIGCFGLTEPLVGSGASRGLTTTAKRDGDTWVLNGQKKWIGNSPWCDISIIWARDLADDQVKAFIVENKTTPGFQGRKNSEQDRPQGRAERLDHDGELPRSGRKPPTKRSIVPRYGARPENERDSWSAGRRRDAPWALTKTRLSTAQERLQFGKPIGSFQMVQDLLAKMLANITASQWPPGAYVPIGRRRQDDRRACLACPRPSRQPSAARRSHGARELLGGNGIVADYNVGRFFVDAEALYSYEGHVPNAEPDSRQGRYRPERFHLVEAYDSATDIHKSACKNARTTKGENKIYVS